MKFNQENDIKFPMLVSRMEETKVGQKHHLVIKLHMWKHWIDSKDFKMRQMIHNVIIL